MSVKIKKINIHAFRGIPELELNIDGKCLLLRGENGTGKSSIVDAIEFFFTGKVSHLEGIKGISLQKHGPHVNFTLNNVNIEITFNPGNISLSRSFTSEPTPPDIYNDYFQVTQKGSFILRRSQILEFIISRPAERFRAIGNIIGINPLDNIELEMKRLYDQSKGKVESIKGQIRHLFSEISKIIGKEIIEINEILSAINKIFQDAGLPTISSLNEVDKYVEERLRTIRTTSDIDKIDTLNKILAIVNKSPISQEIIIGIKAINEKIKYLLQDRRRVELLVAKLLNSGKEIIIREKMNICPLCEQEINRDNFLKRIDQRLQTLTELTKKASEIRTISTQVIEKLNRIMQNLDETCQKIEIIPELSGEREKLLEKLTYLKDFRNIVISTEKIRNEIPEHEFYQRKNEINNIYNSISEKCNQLLNNIGLTDKEKRALEVIRLIEQIRSKIQEISEVNSHFQYCQKLNNLAKKVYSTFSEIKKIKIQEIYDTIQGNIQNFYSILHPTDPHKNIELIVARDKRASTELRIESFGRKEDPRALTSEGHLDSLGLCIFLAFIKEFNEGCPLVILDDIVTTIDANHRDRIARLLLNEFKDYQLFITTHDGIWYEQLINLQRALNMQSNFINIEIISWDKDLGPSITPYKPRWNKILDKLGNYDKTGAGNECRIYLEWLLKEICERLEVPISFKRNGKYTVAELFDPVNKRIVKKLKNSTFKSEILNSLQNLRATTFMGNLLSHDNPEIESLSIKEVETFCNAVHQLHENFLCPSCGKFLKYFKDSKIIRCPDLNCKNSKCMNTN